MKIRTPLLVILMLSTPVTSAEYPDMKMGDMGSFTSPQVHMSGMNEMHEKTMVAVKESDPDKAFTKGMIVHHEGTIAIAETEPRYGKGPGMRKLAKDIIKAQEGEIDQVNKWLDNQK